MTLHIGTQHNGDRFELPIDAVTETFGILAKKGAGKSNAAVVMAEEMWVAGVPWVAIDPKGDWWGLRSSTDGTAPGLPLVVFGGRHGDIPLEPTAGNLIADLVLEHRLTCVLDVSEFSRADVHRFLLAFADRRYRQAEAEPLHLFLEEAHEYLPQVVRGDDARLVGAWQRIVKQGRFKGIGCTLISQRSAALNKDVLTQVDTLIVLRTTSPQDRAAVKAWVDVHSDSAEMLRELPSLANGEAWLWSPEFLGTLARIQFRRRDTFDSGATPKVGQAQRPPATLADVDLGSIKDAMADTIEKAADNDPKQLRKRIATLTARVAELEAAKPEPEIVERVVEVERLVIPPAVLDAARRLVEAIGAPMPAITPAVPPAPSQRPTPRPAPAPAASRRSAGPGESLPGPQRKLLTVLATYGPRTKQQLALQAGYSVNGGGFNNPLGALRSAGYVDKGNPIAITDVGVAVLGDYDPLPTGAELLDHWLAQLPGPCAKILEQIAARWPDGWTKEDLAEAAGYNPQGGGFNNPLGRLRTLGLVTRGSVISLTEEFGEAVSES